MSKHYDSTSPESITNYAKLLEGKSLHDYFGGDIVQTNPKQLRKR